MKRFLFVLGTCLMAAAPSLAHAGTSRDVDACKAMQATLAPRQAEIADLTKDRDAAAAASEAAGEAWDDVEIHRLVSKAHADTADSAKAAYEAARGDLARRELALQDGVQRLNADIAEFNSRCADKP